ncbi:TPA: ATP-binding cassette domain-containing protein [Candidatus Poribacteria bacterium]|jgi:subfamily B ATP-binding cassette protein MsbA|nr:ATP-binding cassette domain-containing protein [Candidatus Poribacteria bacterium]
MDIICKETKAKPLRKQIGIVQQEPFLFNNTIKINITYVKLNATDAEVINATKAANAHDFIMELPKQYETRVGERRVKLSGGQKQRLSIARAILADPKILILDEATSSVDTETEILIQQAIDNLVKDCTTFVIAHRLSTIQHADLIVVLESGRIVETGKHGDLLALNGLYTKLHEVQFRSVDAEPTELPPKRQRRPQQRTQPKIPSFDNMEGDLF